MADLNALIAQGVQFQAPPNPFAQYAQMQQLQQSDQANQLNQMKMEEMRADAEQRNALRRLNPSDPGYEAQLSKLNPSLGIAYRKDRNAASSAETKLIADKLALLPDAYRMADTPEAYYKLHESVHNDPVLGPWLNSVGATKEQGLAKIQQAVSTGTFDKLRMASMQSVNQILEGMKPLVAAPSASVYDPTTGTFKQAPAAPEKLRQTDLQLNYDAAKAQGFVGSIFDYEKKIKEASRAPATPATPAAPVAVVGEDGKVKYVSREEAIGKGMTPASAMEGLSPKEIQNREAKYPVARRAATTVASTMTEIESTIDRLLANESGLNGITGFVGGRTFAITNEARKAEADLKQLKNLAFVQGLTELRNASSTGAGVGNVSNKEGDRFENLKASLDQTQSTSDLIDSLKRLKSQSTSTKNAVNQSFEDTYAYRANAPAAAAPKPAPVAPNIDALLNKYK